LSAERGFGIRRRQGDKERGDKARGEKATWSWRRIDNLRL
jgi:hypothetical protein